MNSFSFHIKFQFLIYLTICKWYGYFLCAVYISVIYQYPGPVPTSTTSSMIDYHLGPLYVLRTPLLNYNKSVSIIWQIRICECLKLRLRNEQLLLELLLFHFDDTIHQFDGSRYKLLISQYPWSLLIRIENKLDFLPSTFALLWSDRDIRAWKNEPGQRNDKVMKSQRVRWYTCILKEKMKIQGFPLSQNFFKIKLFYSPPLPIKCIRFPFGMFYSSPTIMISTRACLYVHTTRQPFIKAFAFIQLYSVFDIMSTPSPN